MNHPIHLFLNKNHWIGGEAHNRAGRPWRRDPGYSALEHLLHDAGEAPRFPGHEYSLTPGEGAAKPGFARARGSEVDHDRAMGWDLSMGSTLWSIVYALSWMFSAGATFLAILGTGCVQPGYEWNLLLYLWIPAVLGWSVTIIAARKAYD